MSADATDASKSFARDQGVEFPLLADQGARVVREYGLLHEGAGLEAPDIAIPAQFLLDSDRKILWRHVAKRVQDRADPERLLRVVEKQWPVQR